MDVLVVFGTRPEAIKMAPVIHALKSEQKINTAVCVTAQHREMLDQVLSIFQITPDFDLDLMKPGQDLLGLTCRVMNSIQELLIKHSPKIVLVHGDTTMV